MELKLIKKDKYGNQGRSMEVYEGIVRGIVTEVKKADEKESLIVIKKRGGLEEEMISMPTKVAPEKLKDSYILYKHWEKRLFEVGWYRSFMSLDFPKSHKLCIHTEVKSSLRVTKGKYRGTEYHGTKEYTHFSV